MIATTSYDAADAPRRKVIVSGVTSDAHTWNLVFLQLLLEESGHEVVNLGSCVPGDYLLARCKETKPDLIVLSSVNGHGHIDGADMIRALRVEPELAATPAVIGGKLGTRGAQNAAFVDKLIEAGFDAVFTDGAPLNDFTSFVAMLPSSRGAAA